MQVDTRYILFVMFLVFNSTRAGAEKRGENLVAIHIQSTYCGGAGGVGCYLTLDPFFLLRTTLRTTHEKEIRLKQDTKECIQNGAGDHSLLSGGNVVSFDDNSPNACIPSACLGCIYVFDTSFRLYPNKVDL